MLENMKQKEENENFKKGNNKVDEENQKQIIWDTENTSDKIKIKVLATRKFRTLVLQMTPSRKWAGRGGSRLESQHLGRSRQVDHVVRSLRPAWPVWWNLISTKNTKISRVWGQAPVIPATQKAETRE